MKTTLDHPPARLIAAFTISSILVLISCVFAGIGSGTSRLDQNDPRRSMHEKASEELRNMSFLLGEWDLETYFLTEAGGTVDGSAQMHSDVILNGMGVRSTQNNVKNSLEKPMRTPPYEITTIWVYHELTKSITGSSLNTLGNRKQLDGQWEDDRLVFIETGNLFRGRSGENRLIFKDIKDDSFRFQLDIRPDLEKPFIEDVYGFTAIRMKN